MNAKRRGLGRGLDALLGGGSGKTIGKTTEHTLDESISKNTVVKDGDLRNVPVDLIHRGKYQPRIDMHPESLEDLANSIRAQGVVQPIVVRPRNDGEYEIIAGERRWRASQMAGLQEVPCVIRDVPDNRAIAMALIENIQRENLNPIEEANALQRLINEFDLTHQEAAEAVGRSRAAVSNLLRLLTLNGEIKQMLADGQLEMGHGRALIGLEGEAQRQLAKEIVAKGLSVRETERRVKHLQVGDQSGNQADAMSKKAIPVQGDPNIRRLQDGLTEKIGVPVTVHHGSSGKGKLVILYNSLDELDGILAHIK